MTAIAEMVIRAPAVRYKTAIKTPNIGMPNNNKITKLTNPMPISPIPKRQRMTPAMMEPTGVSAS